MERRRSPRIPVQVSATLTVLESPEQTCSVTVEDISGNGACVLATIPLKINALVKLTVGEDLFLGEVCHCQSVPEGFRAGLKLDSSLTGVSELRCLMQALLRESNEAPSGRAHAPQTQDDRNHQHSSQGRQK